MDDLDRSAEGVGQTLDVAVIRGDDEIPASGCPNSDRSVDGISGPGLGARRARCASPELVEGFDAASLEQPRELRLRAATPRLAEHAGRHRRAKAALQCSPVQCPHGSVAPLRSDERPGVVGDAAQRSAGPLLSDGHAIEERVGGRELLGCELTVM